MKYVLVFIVLLMTVAVNLPDNWVSRIGFNHDFLMIALVVWVITGLVAHRHLALIVVVVLLSLLANLPAETAANIGIDRDLAAGALIAVVILPLIDRWLS